MTTTRVSLPSASATATGFNSNRRLSSPPPGGRFGPLYGLAPDPSAAGKWAERTEGIGGQRMAAAKNPFDAGLAAAPAELAAAIARLEAEDAVALPLLDSAARRQLLGAAARLSFRPARPVIGEGARAVLQDFELCVTIPAGSLFYPFAAALEDLVGKALALREPAPLSGPMRFNDLIVQRYAAGSRGITPHRDHIRYEGLVALLPLSGAARFFVCAERSGRNAREVPAPAGSLLLMRAPGFAGRRDRPFHFLRDVARRRVSLGLRHDVRAA